jgi:hypothetical protein
MAPMTGPQAPCSQINMGVRGEPEASLHAALGDLRREGHRRVPAGTAGEERGYEDSRGVESSPSGRRRSQGGPTLKARDDEPSSAVHGLGSNGAEK